jgi:hypothetical protein
MGCQQRTYFSSKLIVTSTCVVNIRIASRVVSIESRVEDLLDSLPTISYQVSGPPNEIAGCFAHRPCLAVLLDNKASSYSQSDLRFLPRLYLAIQSL